MQGLLELESGAWEFWGGVVDSVPLTPRATAEPKVQVVPHGLHQCGE